MGLLDFLISFVIFRYFITRPNFADGDQIRITDRVLTEPVRFSDTQRIILAGLRIYLPAYPEVSYGDRVVVEGVISDGKLVDAKLTQLEPAKGVLFRLRRRIVEIYQKTLPEPHSALVAGVVLGSKGSLPGTFWESLKKPALPMWWLPQG